MPLPPGTSAFPPASPSSMQRSFFVSNRRPADGKFDVRGPFMGTVVAVQGSISIEMQGQIVTAEDRIKLPLESAVRARSIVRDVASNIAYEVMLVRTFVDGIDAYVTRKQADT